MEPGGGGVSDWGYLQRRPIEGSLQVRSDWLRSDSHLAGPRPLRPLMLQKQTQTKGKHIHDERPSFIVFR